MGPWAITIYLIRGFLNGRRQREEVFLSEALARLRAAQLGQVYDSISPGTRRVDREAMMGTESNKQSSDRLPGARSEIVSSTEGGSARLFGRQGDLPMKRILDFD